MPCSSLEPGYCFGIILFIGMLGLPFLFILGLWYVLLGYLKFKPLNYITIFILLIFVFFLFSGFSMDVYHEFGKDLSISSTLNYFLVILTVCGLLIKIMHSFYKQTSTNLNTSNIRGRLNRPQN